MTDPYEFDTIEAYNMHREIVKRFSETLNHLAREFPEKSLDFYIEQINKQWKKNTEALK